MAKVNLNPPLTLERLKVLITYDPDSGRFAWKLKRRGPRLTGDPGYTTKYGYRVITLDRKHYHAHRLAWLYMTGAWPPEDTDHINGDRADNRIANLRCVSREGNTHNIRTARRDNRSCGLLGVTWDKQCRRWKARIGLSGRTICLGVHKTAEAAHAAYLDAKRRLHATNTL